MTKLTDRKRFTDKIFPTEMPENFRTQYADKFSSDLALRTTWTMIHEQSCRDPKLKVTPWTTWKSVGLKKMMACLTCISMGGGDSSDFFIKTCSFIDLVLSCTHRKFVSRANLSLKILNHKHSFIKNQKLVR